MRAHDEFVQVKKRSKAEYCYIIWSPTHKKDISRLERIQKGYKKDRRFRKKELSSEAKMSKTIQHGVKKRVIHDN